jgi:CubicO group peptidase (beta-lactamase class C family)
LTFLINFAKLGKKSQKRKKLTKKYLRKILRLLVYMPINQKIFVLLAIGGFSLYANIERKPIKHEPVCVEVKIETAADSATHARIYNILTRAFAEGRFNGHIIYAENGRVLFNSYFGYEDIRTRRIPLSDTSIFQLASTSKPITAVAILMLHEARRLNINNPVVNYLPDFPFQTITIKQLLQHRSGLPNYMHVAHRNWDTRQFMTNADITPLIVRTGARLLFNPGARFHYNNTNYAYLACIIEAVSGQSFPEFMNSRIFQPLGMYNTYVFEWENRNTYRAMRGYDFTNRRGFFARQPDYLDGVMGDKGIFATANDLFIFDQALHNNRLISRELLELAFTPARPFDERHRRDYGLGFRLRLNDDDQVVAFHHGWWRGFRTFYVHDFKNGRTLIWLNNRSDVRVLSLMAEILEYGDIDEDDEPVLGGGDR